ncbi:MAG: amidohydrolase family protein [Tabrizicola sp.]|nr:amidohydrolase family protein [Tabrizicola sp.]
MELIDTHQHLILRDRIGYAWTAEFAALRSGDFTRADYAALTAGRGIVGTIFMETGVDDGDYQAEARMVADMVGTGGMLGQIASIRPETDEGFDAWLDEVVGLNVVGLRRILHVVEDERSQTETFRRNLRKIGARGLPFDLNFLARQLPICEALLRACPDQAYVLDHCGVPDVAAGAFDEWAAGIDLIAPFQNVVVKMSGITTYCAPGTASVALIRPYIERLLQAFGPDRMLWGGDWPVVNLGAGLPGWIGMTRELLAELTPDEQFAIGQGTARRVYRLD